MQKLQLTLAIIKPDAVKNPVALSYIRRVLETQFIVIKTRRVRLDRNAASAFYREHEGKFFYNRLVTFMSSGSVDAHVLGGTECVRRWRDMLGPTSVFRAQYAAPDSLRAAFGLSDTRNVAHGSDSDSAAAREILHFFPEFSWSLWSEREPLYRRGPHVFDARRFEHAPLLS